MKKLKNWENGTFGYKQTRNGMCVGVYEWVVGWLVMGKVEKRIFLVKILFYRTEKFGLLNLKRRRRRKIEREKHASEYY